MRLQAGIFPEKCKPGRQCWASKRRTCEFFCLPSLPLMQGEQHLTLPHTPAAESAVSAQPCSHQFLLTGAGSRGMKGWDAQSGHSQCLLFTLSQPVMWCKPAKLPQNWGWSFIPAAAQGLWSNRGTRTHPGHRPFVYRKF